MPITSSILSWVLGGLALAGTTHAQFNGVATTYGPPDGESPQGGNCALMTWLDFAPRFHAALNDKQWSSGVHCGRCVLVTCTDPRCTSRESVLGQVTDRCPECAHGDLDMSLPMFHKITGYNTDRLTIHWDFVDCPVSGGVQVCAKSGSSKHWLYIQASNAVNGVASMNINGAPAPIFSSAYYFMSQALGVELANTVVSMTSHGGDTIDVKVQLEADKCTQIPQQFAKGSPFVVGLAALGFVAYRSRRRVEEEKQRSVEREDVDEFSMRSLSHILGKTTPTHDIAIL
ncbi:hypothetical protein B5M09_003212 [Aphanomyces astaci]|uniref:Expansin-like EG45 domain-containing protein n=1 Tax=Aphanomyces astaci TaxID=112090 RepID=A0A3R7WKD7_APHAT|nr:hypothetical protein B5M09_003212 [Aphanomyces astaci]